MSGATPQDLRKEQEVISEKVKNLDLEELYQASRMLNNSMALYHLNSMNDMLKSGYRFNTLEQRLFDKFVENYNLNYKSPLAMSMKEDSDEV